MLFHDRNDAGKQLAKALQAYDSQPGTLIVALPRGGVVIGYELAVALHLPLDILIARKIGAPENPEYAIGALTETGTCLLVESAIQALAISPDCLETVIETAKQEARRQLEYYRSGKPPRQVRGKRVILVDDGIATGATVRVAIKTLREEGAKEIVLAVPIAAPESVALLSQEVDKVVVLLTPTPFFAVGQFYHAFDSIPDEAVVDVLHHSCSLVQDKQN